MTDEELKKIKKKEKPNCPKCKKGFMVGGHFTDRWNCNKCGHKVYQPDPIQIMIGGY